MPEYIYLNSLSLFQIRDENGVIYFGADQEWYQEIWQRRAGCGPTNCAQLLWYLSQTDLNGRALVQFNMREKSGALSLMEEVWQYVTPGGMGVNSTELFCKGAAKYGESRDVPLAFQELKVPAFPLTRPSQKQVMDFIARMISNDIPIAFLNLSNGALRNLENWHWVTLVGFSPEKMTAIMYDQGESHEIDIGLWLKTTTLGGGFVGIQISGTQIE